MCVYNGVSLWTVEDRILFMRELLCSGGEEFPCDLGSWMKNIGRNLNLFSIDSFNYSHS